MAEYVGKTLTRTQVDRLGERLKTGEPSEADFRQLDSYRRSFMEPYEFVVKVVRDQLNLEPTGRPAKSTVSIRDKLRRESIRLSQMQDIAGCRMVVDDLVEQDRIATSLLEEFSDTTVVDRRSNPSHGYRAVHVIVRLQGRSIEIQIRTALQHLWAEFSEKLADIFDPALKYGGGAKDLVKVLLESSAAMSRYEILEKRMILLVASGTVGHEIDALQAEMALSRKHLVDILETAKTTVMKA